MRVAVAHEWLTNWAGSERVARELVTVGQAEQLVASVVDRSFTAEYFPDVDVRALWTSRLPTATTHWSRFALPDARRVGVDEDRGRPAARQLALRRARGDGAVRRAVDRLLPHAGADAVASGHRAGPPAGAHPRRGGEGRAAGSARVGPAGGAAPDRHAGQLDGRRGAHRRTPTGGRPRSCTRRSRSTAGRPCRAASPSTSCGPGRLVAYKRPDIAVEAARISGEELVIVGSGPERARLEPTAPPNVRFVGHVSEAELRDLIGRRARAGLPGRGGLRDRAGGGAGRRHARWSPTGRVGRSTSSSPM